MTKRSLKKIVEQEIVNVNERVCNTENYETDDRVDDYEDMITVQNTINL